MTYSSLTMYSKLVATADAVYVVGVSKSFASFTLHITSLNPSTGAVLSTRPVSSSITEPLSELLVLSSSHPDSQGKLRNSHVVWLEQGILKYVLLTSKLDGKTKSLKGLSIRKIVDAGLSDNGHFVAITVAGVNKVVMMEGDNVKDVLEFEGVVSSYFISTIAGTLTHGHGLDC